MLCAGLSATWLPAVLQQRTNQTDLGTWSESESAVGDNPLATEFARQQNCSSRTARGRTERTSRSESVAFADARLGTAPVSHVTTTEFDQDAETLSTHSRSKPFADWPLISADHNEV